MHLDGLIRVCLILVKI